MTLVHSPSAHTQPRAADGCSSPPKRGPVRILCDEIGFQFDQRIERPDVLIAFVRELLAEVQEQHNLSVSVARYTSKKPPEETADALALAWVMVASPLREILSVAAAVHDLSHQLNPDDTYPTNHTIDMISSCASAIRFGLESPCASRHAAEASNHVWKHVYGVSRFDRNTPAWQHEWARSKLHSAIISLLPAEARTAAESPSVGTKASAEVSQKDTPDREQALGGWQTMPVEPTKKMRAAGAEALDIRPSEAALVFAAMCKAAPAPDTVSTKEGE